MALSVDIDHFNTEISYWTYQFRSRGWHVDDPVLHRTAYMSYALNKWSCLEEKMHLVGLFAPDGPLQA